MYSEEISLTIVILTIVASCGGTMLRYIEEARALKKFRFAFLCADLLGSAFIGFYVGWYLLHSHLLKLPEVMLVLILTGFLGSKVFNLISYFLAKKFGINLKYIKDEILELTPDDQLQNKENNKDEHGSRHAQ